MRSVYMKTLYDRRIFMVGWTLGMAAFAALMVVFYPAMNQQGSLDALVASMPPAFQGLVGDLTDLSSFDTYLASQLFDIRLSIIVGIMAIIVGLGLSVADEEKGELRTLLSLPISRLKLFIQKWLAMVTIFAVTLLGLVAGMYAVLPFIDASIEIDQTLRLIAMAGLLMITFGTIPFAIGFMSGKRGVAMAISTVVIIGSFILTTFGKAVEWLSDYEKLSLLHYFPAVDIVKGTIELTDVIVLSVITLGLLGVALFKFRRRDVN